MEGDAGLSGHPPEGWCP